MKIRQLLLAAAAMVMAVACNEVPEPTPEVTLSVEPALVEFVAEGGEQTVALTANAAWIAEPSEEWIKLDVTSGTEGQDVKVTAEPNEAEEAREGKVVFAAGDKKAELVVKQTAVEAPAVCAASGSITDIEWMSSHWGAGYGFNLTTANAVAASWLLIASEYVNETYTAEFILSELGGTALEVDYGLNEEDYYVEYLRCENETEYTIFLAYKDEAGLTGMVTETVTSPQAPTVYEDWDATSAIANSWPNEQESDVIIEGAEFKVKITLSSATIEVDRDYALLDPDYPDAGVCISKVSISDLDDELIAISACFTSANFSILSEEGAYGTNFSGAGTLPGGKPFKVQMFFNGLPEGVSVGDVE